MSDRTSIEWTDATWNPLRGCSRVSEGCRHCYAERIAARFSGSGQPYAGLIHEKTRGWNGKVEFVESALGQPLRWRRSRRVFVNSMSDLFHETVPDEWIDRVFAVMALAHWHTFQVLTKRPERMLRWLDPRVDNREHAVGDAMREIAAGLGQDDAGLPEWPLPNVWLGVSVEDQATADKRIPLLLRIPAAVRWVSAEPLLECVDLSEHLGMWWNQTMGAWEGAGQRINIARDGRPRIGWVVVGGESGPDARPMHPHWVRTLRDQCQEAGVPFLFKQWGAWLPMLGHSEGVPVREKIITTDGLAMGRAGKKAAGRLLDGVLHDGYPEAHWR